MKTSYTGIERRGAARPRRRLAIAIAVAALGASSCGGGETKPAAPKPPPAAASPLAPPASDPSTIRLPQPTTEDLTDNALRAKLVVLATVVWLGPPPSKPKEACSTQGVSYRVDEVYRGDVSAAEIRVAQPVCMGQPLVDNLALGLSRDAYAPGKKFVLFLEPDQEGSVRYSRYDGDWTSTYSVWDRRNGALPDSDALREQVGKAVASVGS